MNRLLFIIALLVFLTVAAPALRAGIVIRSIDDTATMETLVRVAERITASNPATLTHLRAINAPYKKLKEAIPLFADDRNADRIIGLLRAGWRADRHNHIAALFLGIYLNEYRSFKESVPPLYAFLREAPFPSDIEVKFMTPQETERLLAYVSQLFASHNEPQPKPRVPMNVLLQKSLLRFKSFPQESLLGAILALCSMVGVILLLTERLLYRFTPPTDIPHYWQVLKPAIAFTVASYVLWLVHLYLGIEPLFGGTLTRELLTVLGAGFTLILIVAVVRYLRHSHLPDDDPQLTRCPHCKKPVLRVAAECPHCKRTIENQ